ncbi:secondary thiamine-phosphate synthase enzyme YjbQ [Geomonas sp. RF6]|uniref:secondary thiamine-phosphate synthase enzyme YjbQ n=1 Tax=Geomonas sp. RF6 TaxID=2897342 RepID=UPI001E4DF8A2|nr:secondary thiamine-phosphate synthase enzyme YjbQ [Geomonas sp. RF6]UFS71582.1 secondary thiamine-phosphate synthase enzyme YjbQ [Geomonas sp. RF6]
MVHYLKVESKRKSQMIDITERVQQLVESAGVREGICDVFVPHTTAAVTINEGADPAVQHDMVACLDRLVPDAPYFTHAEGNSAAHVKTTLVGSSERIFIEGGRLILGTWQAIFFCEFDGPRSRKVAVSISG